MYAYGLFFDSATNVKYEVTFCEREAKDSTSHFCTLCDAK
jgi:hypothetical protein